MLEILHPLKTKKASSFPGEEIHFNLGPRWFLCLFEAPCSCMASLPSSIYSNA